MNEIFIYVSPWISIVQTVIHNEINIIHPALNAGLFDTGICQIMIIN